MTDDPRRKFLRIALRSLALFLIFGLYPMTIVWPAGWAWTVGESDYLEMIVAMYATLGVFLWIAARDPDRHRSLVSFAIWSSIAHGSVMSIQVFADPARSGHLSGDIPALFLAAAVLAILSPSSFWLKTD